MDNLPELFQKLNTAFHSGKIKARDTRFVGSLLDFYKAKSRWSENQLIYVKKFVTALDTPEIAAKKREVPPRLQEMLQLARTHLKFPKMTIPLKEGKLTCYLNTFTEENKVLFRTDDRQYVAVIVGNQLEFTSRATDEHKAIILELISNPDTFLALKGKEFGNCCFCGLKLSDDRSISAGYGPICAEHYGLAWGLTADLPDVSLMDLL